MPTVNSNGTQTATITTEHTLADITTNKWFSAYVDLTNMALNDTTELRIYVKIKSAGSAILYYMQSFSNVQSNPIVYFAPMPSDLEWKLTLKQTAGTGRNYDWRVFEA